MSRRVSPFTELPRMSTTATPVTEPDPIVSLPTRHRSRLIAAALIAVLVSGLGLALAALPGAFDSGPSSVPLTGDPAAVAAAYLRLDAVGDPGMCTLSAPNLRSQLTLAGRCTGSPAGQRPDIMPLHAPVVCGDRATADVLISPSTGFPAPYATVDMEQTDQGWRVLRVLFQTDSAILQRFPCDIPHEYNG